MASRTTDDNPMPAVAVDEFLERLLPEAVGAVSDPEALDRLEPRQLLTYMLQILHAELCASAAIDEDDDD
jgi:hypothetical protein